MFMIIGSLWLFLQIFCFFSNSRFHKLVWGNYGMSKGDFANGTVIGGTDNGGIYVYDAAKLLSSSEALIHKMDKVS